MKKKVKIYISQAELNQMLKMKDVEDKDFAHCYGTFWLEKEAGLEVNPRTKYVEVIINWPLTNHK